MLERIHHLFAAAALLALVSSTSTALAGGVIIDGRGNEPQFIDAPGPAAPDSGSDPTAQQVYLWATYVFSVQPPVQGPEEDADIDVEEPATFDTAAALDTNPRIVEDLDLEAAGGCAAAPASLLTALVAVLALRRRRR